MHRLWIDGSDVLNYSFLSPFRWASYVHPEFNIPVRPYLQVIIFAIAVDLTTIEMMSARQTRPSSSTWRTYVAIPVKVALALRTALPIVPPDINLKEPVLANDWILHQSRYVGVVATSRAIFDKEAGEMNAVPSTLDSHTRMRAFGMLPVWN